MRYLGVVCDSVKPEYSPSWVTCLAQSSVVLWHANKLKALHIHHCICQHSTTIYRTKHQTNAYAGYHASKLIL
jgi:hypothetical protein